MATALTRDLPSLLMLWDTGLIRSERVRSDLARKISTSVVRTTSTDRPCQSTAQSSEQVPRQRTDGLVLCFVAAAR